jgi:hypothetical protein
MSPCAVTRTASYWLVQPDECIDCAERCQTLRSVPRANLDLGDGFDVGHRVTVVLKSTWMLYSIAYRPLARCVSMALLTCGNSHTRTCLTRALQLLRAVHGAVPKTNVALQESHRPGMLLTRAG